MQIPTEELPVRVILPSSSNSSVVVSVSTAIREVHRSRHVIYRLFLRDFVTQFRQKLLGYFWAVISPLMAIVSFVFMSATGFLNPGEMGYPYTIYVFVGVSLWGTMIATLTTISGGLLGNSDLMMRTSIPPIALALAGMANVVYSALVGMVTLGLVLFFADFPPSPFIILYPLLLIPIILVGVGIGLILAVIGAVARDVTSAVVSAIGLWMYVTPVIYVAKFENPVLQFMTTYNPIGYLVDMPRSLILTGQMTDWLGYVLSTGFSIGLLIIGVHGFYLIKDKVAERL